MENNVNLNEMKFRRNEGMENQAVTGILSLFTDESWEETSKITARQEMALVLSQMRDACILTQSTEETPEHLMIAHSNGYFNRLISQFESNAPLTVAISGNTFDDMMRNLRLIYDAAQSEPHAKEITERMNIFFQKIEQMASDAMATQNKANKYKLISGIVGTGLFLFAYLYGIRDTGKLELFDIIIIILMTVGVFTGFAAVGNYIFQIKNK